MLRKAMFATLALAALAVTAAAQSKPNFSGTWKLNVAKSDFGPIPGPDSRTDVIVHSDPSIKDSVTAEGQQGKQDYAINYTTDGKEVVNKVGPREIKSTAVWEGSTLVVNSKLSFNDNDITIKAVWTLSEDGKTLTQNVHLNSPMGEADQKVVFEKQGEGAAATASAPASAPATVTSGAKPNFSGTWKLSISKSDFGVLPGPDSQTSIIDHKDPSLKVDTTSDGAQGKQQYTLTFTTDGKESTNTPMEGRELKSTVVWQGKNLVVDTKLKFQDNDVTIKTVWILSDDGKTLTENAHLASPMGETDQKLVFEKQ